MQAMQEYIPNLASACPVSLAFEMVGVLHYVTVCCLSFYLCVCVCVRACVCVYLCVCVLSSSPSSDNDHWSVISQVV